MSEDENPTFADGERLGLIIVVTKLIRGLYAAKLVFLQDPQRSFLGASPCL